MEAHIIDNTPDATFMQVIALGILRFIIFIINRF